MNLLAQTESITEVAKTALSNANEHSGGVFLAVVLIVTLATMMGVYWWLILAPNEKANREVSARLADSTSAISRVVSETHERAGEIFDNSTSILASINGILACRELEVVIFQKLAAKGNPEIQPELAKMEAIISHTRKIDESRK